MLIILKWEGIKNKRIESIFIVMIRWFCRSSKNVFRIGFFDHVLLMNKDNKLSRSWYNKHYVHVDIIRSKSDKTREHLYRDIVNH